MVTYAAPGAYVEERLAALETPPADVDATALGCFIGPLNRGPSRPVVCRSWADFKNTFGGFDGDQPMPFAVYSYFQNGGRNALIVRVAGAGATAATRTLRDVGGNDALRVTAVNAGAWGGDITIDVTAAGTPGRFNLFLLTNGVQLERFGDLSMDPADRRYAPAVLTAQSALVNAEALGSASIGDNTALLPQGANALDGGTNGTAPTAAAVRSARDALELIDAPMVLNLPGADDVDLVSDYLNWCEQRGSVFLVVDVPLGRDPDGAQDFAGDLFPTTDPSAADGFAQRLIPTSYGALYYPGLVVADPASRVPGATRVIPPGGAMVGQYATTDASQGVFKAPAGLGNRIVGAVALERQLTEAERGRLHSAAVPINPLRIIPGGGIVPFGARTMKPGGADKYIPTRRTLIYLRDALLDLTRFAVFESNDPSLWDSIKNNITSFLMDFYNQGGLRGGGPAEAFYVKCDASLNNRQAVENGEVRVEVGVALQYPSEFIVISLGQFEGGATITDNVPATGA